MDQPLNPVASGNARREESACGGNAFPTRQSPPDFGTLIETLARLTYPGTTHLDCVKGSGCDARPLNALFSYGPLLERERLCPVVSFVGGYQQSSAAFRRRGCPG